MEETGTAQPQISTHTGVEGGDVLVRNGDWGRAVVVGVEGKGRRVCIVSSECGRRARLVASWPPAPDGCIIDAHPSSRAAGATGRVKCDGVGVDWDPAFNRAGGRV